MEKSGVHFDGNLFDKIMITFFRHLNMFFLNTKKPCHEPMKVMTFLVKVKETTSIYSQLDLYDFEEFIQYWDFFEMSM